MTGETKPTNIIRGLASDIATATIALVNYVEEINKNILEDKVPGEDAKNLTSTRLRLLNTAQKILRFRRAREKIFAQPDAFFDPSWDILLDLFVAHLKQIDISVTSACIASQVPLTTALRWVGALESWGLIMRKKDPKDNRRVFLKLTPSAVEKLSQLLGEFPFSADT